MMVVKIHTLNQVKNKILKNRAKRAAGGRTMEFYAVVDGAETGFLSYEDWSDQNVGFVYEIYVLPDFRSQKLGSALLLFAENIAIQLRCTTIRLNARAIDSDMNQELLISWYERKGFAKEPNSADKMEKMLYR